MYYVLAVISVFLAVRMYRMNGEGLSLIILALLGLHSEAIGYVTALIILAFYCTRLWLPGV